MDFGQIIGRAFQITLRYRALWLFGFLLALFGGGGGGGGANFNFGGGGGNRPGPTQPGGAPIFPGLPPELDPNEIARRIGEIPPSAWITIAIIAAIIGFIFAILSAIVSNVAKTAMIGMVDQVETVGATSVGQGFSIGWSRYAWRNFLMEFLLIIIVVIVVSIFVGLLLATGVGGGLLSGSNADLGGPIAGVMCLLLCIFLPIFIIGGIILGGVQTFASRFIVLREAGVRESLSAGWRLFRSNLVTVIIMMLIVFGLSLAWGIVTGITGLVTGGLFGFGAGLLTYVLTQSVGVAILAGLPGLLLAMLLLAALNALFVVFTETIWTLTYRALVDRPSEATAELRPIMPVA